MKRIFGFLGMSEFMGKDVPFAFQCAAKRHGAGLFVQGQPAGGEFSEYRLAIDTGIPHSRVTAIIKGKRSITLDTALRLGRYFGNSAEFWVGLQREFDLRKARAELGPAIEREVAPMQLAS